MSIRWHDTHRTCPHSNDDVCPTCDFDGYYAANYPDCPWRDCGHPNHGSADHDCASFLPGAAVEPQDNP